MSPDDPRHGTYAGGRVHRKAGQDPCEDCRRAEARYEQARVLDNISGRPRRVPAAGTRRRIQALLALGHSFARQGEALGMTGSAAWTFAHRDAPMVRATTAAKVASLYEAWSMILPPAATTQQQKAAAYARTVAAKHGWPPPLAWDDIDQDAEPATGESVRDYIDEAVIDRFFNSVSPSELRGLASDSTTATRHAITDAWLDTGRSWNDLERITGWQHGRYGRTRRTIREGDAA